MAVLPPGTVDILSAVISLAWHGGESFPAHKAHSVLFSLKPKYSTILAAVNFSITGAIFYSRDVEHAIRKLVNKGVLRKNGGTLVVTKGGVAIETAEIRDKFPKPVLRNVASASEKFRREVSGDGENTKPAEIRSGAA